MQVISVREFNGIITVGFREYDFAVYADVPFVEDEPRDRLLQRAYIVAKDAIDYERLQEHPSLITDEEGEEFIPDEPFPFKIVLKLPEKIQFEAEQSSASVELLATVYDQYGGGFEAEVEWSSTLGEINGETLAIEAPDTIDRAYVTAKYHDITQVGEIQILPYVEPKKPIEEKLQEELDDLKDENVMNMMAMVEMYEKNVQLEAEANATMFAVTELYELLMGGE